ncbi:MAG: hypothetical protein AB7O49_03630 [Sphingomonadales bacterium]
MTLRIAGTLLALLAAAALTLQGAVAAPAAPVVVSGAQTRGGEGGTEYLVTNLNDDGPGSLRAALDKPGPAIVKFEVGGVIRLQKPLRLREDRTTVAGETAPSPGITLVGAPLRIRARDVIVRHLRIRVGDARPAENADDRDGITILGSRKGSAPSSNVLIQNCSISWAIDENVSLWFPDIKAVTIRDSIIAEGLNNSLHSKGAHSMGLIVGSGARDVLIQGNLFAHNRWRNPVITAGVTALVLNNVMYDPGDQALHFYNNANKPAFVTIKGNVVRPGPSSHNAMKMFDERGAVPGSRIHMSDNDAGGTGALDPRSPERPGLRFDPYVDELPVIPGPGIKAEPASATLKAVLKNAGARPWDRDATDRRIIAEVTAGGGKLRDTVPPGEMP